MGFLDIFRNKNKSNNTTPSKTIPSFADASSIDSSENNIINQMNTIL